MWIDKIDKIIDVYNNTPHKTLEYLTPNEASLDEHRKQILNINLLKSQVNKSTSDLSIGDNVRIRIGNIFKKGTEPSFSDDIYEVINTDNNKILLSNGKKYKRSSLLKVIKPVTPATNIIKEATRKHKNVQLHKRISIDSNNIIDKNDISNKRKIKQPERYRNWVQLQE